MAFRIKDLMITVLPPGGEDLARRCDAGCSRIQCSDYAEPSRALMELAGPEGRRSIASKG